MNECSHAMEGLHSSLGLSVCYNYSIDAVSLKSAVGFCKKICSVGLKSYVIDQITLILILIKFIGFVRTQFIIYFFASNSNKGRTAVC